MIYFLYGPDTYRSRAKLRDIVAAFQGKTGDAGRDLGYTRIDAADDPAAVFGVGRTRSLFAEKELIVIERASQAPAAVAAHVEGQLERWAGDRNVIVVFWEEEAATKKPSLAGKVLALAEKSQEFKPLAPAAASRWLDDEAKSRGMRLAIGEKRLLLSNCGSDLWALSNELGKIQYGWLLRAPGQAPPAIWDFTDAFLLNRRSAYVPLARLFRAGFDAIPLTASLGGALRSMAIVWKGIQTDRLKTLARRLHPFVVRKNMELARRMDGAALCRCFTELVRADTELKTGRPPSPLPLVRMVLTPSPRKD